MKGDQTTTKNPNSVVTESVEKTTEIQVSTTSENLNFTTLSSTTLSSTTLSSTTLSSTTLNPTTLNPTTLSSSTLNPATLNPTTLNSTTLSPTVSTSKTSTSTSLTTDFSTSSSPFQTNRFSTVTLTSLTPLIGIATKLASPKILFAFGFHQIGFSPRDLSSNSSRVHLANSLQACDFHFSNFFWMELPTGFFLNSDYRVSLVWTIRPFFILIFLVQFLFFNIFFYS